ncbi:MAG: hypothetical protein H6711_07940 [Myxococcales bacterium]|nr:hypothetical protein [Myxococcales bacterium]
MPYQVGQDIDAWCTRCRLDTTHVIVAMASDGTKPKRVECTSCHGQHNYRPPKTAKATAAASRGSGPVSRKALAVAAAKAMAEATAEAMPAGHKPKPKPPVVTASAPAAPKTPRKRAAAKTAKPRTSRAAEAAASDWSARMEMADLTGARKYSMRERYAEGDIVEHPTFGVGFVVDVADPQKAGILFEGGVRVLAMGR